MSKSKPTMQEYKNAVNSLAKDKSATFFRNSSPDHAAIVLTAMISHSENFFYIYDEAFDGDIADRNFEFKTAIKYYLKAGKKIHVVLRSGAKRDSDVYKSFSQFQKRYPDSLQIREASTSFTQAITTLYGKDINFAVADGVSLRVELADSHEENNRTAMCSFNRPDYAHPLVDVFNQNFESCRLVSMP
jgi:hypothetical protein